MATALVYEDLTVGTGAAGFATTFTGSGENLKTSFVTLDTADIRYTVDGTTPTATSGHAMVVGDKLWLGYKEMRNFKAIRSGGSDGKIRATHGLRRTGLAIA